MATEIATRIFPIIFIAVPQNWYCVIQMAAWTAA